MNVLFPCCITSDFVLKNFAQLKAANPKLPILVRESSGVQPRVTARFCTFGTDWIGMPHVV
jgi:hypothetical protein